MTHKAEGWDRAGVNEVSKKDGMRGLLDGSQWRMKDVESDAIEALQVELSRSNGSLDVKYVTMIYPYSLATVVIMTNNGRKVVKLKAQSSAISDPNCEDVQRPEGEDKPRSWTVQEVPHTILENKISRVYATPPAERQNQFYNKPPTKYETVDQGCELFFRMIKMGFEDIYLSSPGSFSKKYGKEYFICTGLPTMLVPAVVEPGKGWRGPQVIEHDNLSKQFSPNKSRLISDDIASVNSEVDMGQKILKYLYKTVKVPRRAQQRQMTTNACSSSINPALFISGSILS
ncbi:hypothetical protein MLD38_015871 [Melastoma candidum]|uniref:Uncharacterized protein n=1 Tax=Melastoma candidum TaxID=119954 RepID=A0ACB9RHR2_9MYRT|nr:hypothetical protein MLD38_015871 [Melastoma candidum]